MQCAPTARLASGSVHTGGRSQCGLHVALVDMSTQQQLRQLLHLGAAEAKAGPTVARMMYYMT
jgi:hypothetical protein